MIYADSATEVGAGLSAPFAGKRWRLDLPDGYELVLFETAEPSPPQWLKSAVIQVEELLVGYLYLMCWQPMGPWEPGARLFRTPEGTIVCHRIIPELQGRKGLWIDLAELRTSDLKTSPETLQGWEWVIEAPQGYSLLIFESPECSPPDWLSGAVIRSHPLKRSWLYFIACRSLSPASPEVEFLEVPGGNIIAFRRGGQQMPDALTG